MSKLSIVQAKTRQNLDGKSKLFFNYLDALNTIKPKYFLLENVASMNQESKDTISKLVGVEPVKINSSSFSAQERERLYWTNIPLDTSTLKESPLMLKDILEENPDPKYFYNYPLTNINLHKQVCAIMEHSNTQMHKRVFNPNFKCRTLTCVNGGNQHKKVYVDGKARKLTPIEYERLQTLPDDYTSGISETRRYSACGNGWTVDVIAYILKGLI